MLSFLSGILWAFLSWVLWFFIYIHPVLYGLSYIFYKVTCGWCSSKRCMLGKTVIITGGNAGIGFETAKDLACRGARVILACRNPEKGQQAADEVIALTGNKNVVFRQLDLASFASVRRFSKEIMETEERLDVLINNAGLSNKRKRELTEDGYELAMQTNHLGHFLLTNLLLGLLEKSAPSRVVVVSSRSYYAGRLNFDDILTGNNWNPHLNYPSTKYANILFANELASRMAGKGVTVNSVHPGAVKTKIFCLTPKSLFKYCLISYMWPMFKSPEGGAQPLIHCAVSDECGAVTGKYFEDCRVKWTLPKVHDRKLGKELWDFSVKVTGLDLES